MFGMTPDERYNNNKHPELKERQIRLDKLQDARDMYYISLSNYEQELKNGNITKDKYDEKFGIVNKLLEKNQTDIASIYKEIRESIPDVTENLLEKNERLKRDEAGEEAGEEAVAGGGKRKSKGKSKKVAKKPVVSQKKQSIYKEILGKQMKIYKMPDSRKEYVKYKGDLHLISDYKDLMKQKAIAKTKTKTKATQQKAKSKTKK